MSKEQWVYALRWTNPYTEPPNGLPRVLGTWIGREPTLGERLDIYPDYKLGCGFSICIQFPMKPIKRMDAEKKKRMRDRAKKTLEMNRVKKKLPLLADILIRDEELDWRQQV